MYQHPNKCLFNALNGHLQVVLDQMQLDLNVLKSQVLIVNQHSKVAFTSGEKWSFQPLVGQSFQFEIVQNFTYLGYFIPNTLSFDEMCKNIHVNKKINESYSLFYHPNIPISVKMIILNRYVLPKILHNAAIYGLYLVHDVSNLSKFRKYVDEPIANLIKCIYMKSNSDYVSNTAMYEEAQTPIPCIFSEVQSAKMIMKLISNPIKNSHLVDSFTHKLCDLSIIESALYSILDTARSGLTIDTRHDPTINNNGTRLIRYNFLPSLPLSTREVLSENFSDENKSPVMKYKFMMKHNFYHGWKNFKAKSWCGVLMI